MVLFSHLFERLPFNIGTSAVANFLILSGYVMTFIIHKHFSGTGRPTIYFYFDRLLRIYPQYLFFMLLTQTLLLIFPFKYGFFSGQPSWTVFLLNLLIVPVNYFMFYKPLGEYTLIPPAWSLGMEEQFYWVFPFLVFFPIVGRSLTVLSAGIFTMAVLDIYVPNLFVLRFLPGVLFMFMMGKYLAKYQLKKSKQDLVTVVALYLLVLVLFVLAHGQFGAAHSYKSEVLSGILVGFPILAILSKLKRKRWDEIIGNSSYGIFLCHILVWNIMMYFHIFDTSYWVALPALIVFSTALGSFSYLLVERPTRRYRHRLRESVLKLRRSDGRRKTNNL